MAASKTGGRRTRPRLLRPVCQPLSSLFRTFASHSWVLPTPLRVSARSDATVISNHA